MGLLETAENNDAIGDFLDNALVIGIIADAETREKRIRERNPTMSEEKITRRVEGEDDLIRNKAHIVIENNSNTKIEEIQKTGYNTIKVVLNRLFNITVS